MSDHSVEEEAPDHGTRQGGTPMRGSSIWCSDCGAYLTWIEWWSWHRRAGQADPSPHMDEDKRAKALEGK